MVKLCFREAYVSCFPSYTRLGLGVPLGAAFSVVSVCYVQKVVSV